MLFLYFFIKGNSNVKGYLNYIIINYIISLLLLVGIIFSNTILLLVGVLGKCYFFPFLFVSLIVVFNTSYFFLIIDLISKFSLLIVLILVNLNGFSSLGYTLIFFNLLIIVFYIKFIFSIKHLIFISSFMFFIFLFLFS